MTHQRLLLCIFHVLFFCVWNPRSIIHCHHTHFFSYTSVLYSPYQALGNTQLILRNSRLFKTLSQCLMLSLMQLCNHILLKRNGFNRFHFTRMMLLIFPDLIRLNSHHTSHILITKTHIIISQTLVLWYKTYFYCKIQPFYWYLEFLHRIVRLNPLESRLKGNAGLYFQKEIFSFKSTKLIAESLKKGN